MSAANVISCADVAAAEEACVSKLSTDVLTDCDLAGETADFDVVAKQMIALVCGN
jgi:hypothetical protein